jgi:hypothetical protein
MVREITPIVHYKSSDGRVTLRIRLARDNGMLIALSEEPKRFGITPPEVHVTGTSANDAGIFLEAGTYTTTLDNGLTVRSVIGAVPPPINLTPAKWHLSAEDWQPANPYATTFGVEASKTRKERVELDLEGLKTWPAIPIIKDVSGLGT